jgi:uncharacterized cupin superfamily protein
VTAEARLTETDTGLVPEGTGWFVLNAREASWQHIPRMGTWLAYEAEGVQQPIGIGIHVLMPGESPGRYHAESDQEGFLVLAGECLLIVEGEERPMRQWDYFHCPPGTAHIIVGAGDGPCPIVMMGGRTPDGTTDYIPDPVAARHGVAVSERTPSSREAYADMDRTVTRVRPPWPPA